MAARSAREEETMPRAVRRVPAAFALWTVGPGRHQVRPKGSRRPLRSRPVGGLVPVLLVAVLVVSACGGRSPAPQSPAATSPTAQEGSFPVTVKAANGPVTIEQRPERIVALSPTATEMLFAIGAGDQVIAVDDNSNYPPEAPMSDLSALDPNVEAVAEFEPDLVVISNDVNDIVMSLEALDIPVMLHPAAETLDDTYAQIEQLGTATGQVAEAAELVATMRSEIERLVGSVPEFEDSPTYYHELDQTFFSVTSETFIGQIYSLVGLKNIADQAKGGGPYPQLSAEFILDEDPDIVFLADTKCCGVTAERVAKRPGWDELTAVKTEAVVELDDDIASRWGPRVVDFLRVVVGTVSELQTVAG
jgi:iron complex transport system substrate-binding protein